MKALRYGIGILIIVAVVGYSGFWYSRANKLENDMVSYLKQCSGLEYDAIEKGGFPTAITIAIKNPRFKANLAIDTLSSQLFTLSLDGKLKASFGVFQGGLKGLEYAGKTSASFPKSDDQPLTTLHFDGVISAKNNSGYLLSPKSLNSLQTSDHFALWPNLHLESESCHITNFKMMQPIDQRVVAAFDTLTLDVQNKKEKGENALNVQSNIEGLYYGDASPLLREMYAHKGKTNCRLDFSAIYPSKKQLKPFLNDPVTSFFEVKLPTLSCTLKQLDSSNSFGHFHAQGAFALHEDDAKNLSIASRFTAQAKENKNYYDFLVSLVRAAGQETPTSAPQSDFQKHLLELIATNNDAVVALIPHIDQLGTIEFSKDFTFEFNKANFQNKFSLQKLMLHCALYGLNVHGTINGAPAPAAAPFSGTMTVDLYNYKDMVRDAISYYNRATKALSSFSPIPYNELSPGTGDKIIAILQQASDNPDEASKNDISITLHYDDNIMTIGTLTLPEIIPQASELMYEIMNQAHPQPAPELQPQPAMPFLPQK